ncbi:MAG: hypothetical protein AAGA80_12420 [Cyanobacteria bacterium P01_F01_bin.143]
MPIYKVMSSKSDRVLGGIIGILIAGVGIAVSLAQKAPQFESLTKIEVSQSVPIEEDSYTRKGKEIRSLTFSLPNKMQVDYVDWMPKYDQLKNNLVKEKTKVIWINADENPQESSLLWQFAIVDDSQTDMIISYQDVVEERKLQGKAGLVIVIFGIGCTLYCTFFDS